MVTDSWHGLLADDGDELTVPIAKNSEAVRCDEKRAVPVRRHRADDALEVVRRHHIFKDSISIGQQGRAAKPRQQGSAVRRGNAEHCRSASSRTTWRHDGFERAAVKPNETSASGVQQLAVGPLR